MQANVNTDHGYALRQKPESFDQRKGEQSDNNKQRTAARICPFKHTLLQFAVRIAVHSSLSSEKIIVPGTENVEIIFVKINIGIGNIFVCCMYVPSNSPVSMYCSCADAINKFFEFITLSINYAIFKTGDFNMREVDWTPDPEIEIALLPGISSSGHVALKCVMSLTRKEKYWI